MPTPGRPTLGRPRAKGPSTSGLSTEQDILAAAAGLFCEIGYGSASTHKIAAAAGLSQATMYHYFDGKHVILLRLLLDTVRPSVAYAEQLREASDSPARRLRSLCVYDVGLLLAGPDNIGSLYLLPELGDERFAEFHHERQRLFGVYRELVAEILGVDSAAAHAGASIVFGLVESVILRRRTEPDLDADAVADSIADAALRVLGADARTDIA